MLPRNKIIIFSVLLFLMLCPVNTMAQDKNIFIKFFQDHISAIDGDRCPMHTSCSEYAAESIKKHGAITGWIMASDRLMRCGRDEIDLSPQITKNGQQYSYDPVEANDFWWVKKTDND